MYSFILLLAASAATPPPDLDLSWLDPVLTEALEHELDNLMTDSALCGPYLDPAKPCHVQLSQNSSCTAVSAGALSLDDVGPQLLDLTLKGLTASCAFLLTIVHGSVETGTLMGAISVDGTSITEINIDISSIDWRLQLTTTSGVPTAATYVRTPSTDACYSPADPITVSFDLPGLLQELLKGYVNDKVNSAVESVLCDVVPKMLISGSLSGVLNTTFSPMLAEKVVHMPPPLPSQLSWVGNPMVRTVQAWLTGVSSVLPLLYKPQPMQLDMPLGDFILVHSVAIDGLYAVKDLEASAVQSSEQQLRIQAGWERVNVVLNVSLLGQLATVNISLASLQLTALVDVSLDREFFSKPSMPQCWPGQLNQLQVATLNASYSAAHTSLQYDGTSILDLQQAIIQPLSSGLGDLSNLTQALVQGAARTLINRQLQSWNKQWPDRYTSACGLDLMTSMPVDIKVPTLTSEIVPLPPRVASTLSKVNFEHDNGESSTTNLTPLNMNLTNLTLHKPEVSFSMAVPAHRWFVHAAANVSNLDAAQPMFDLCGHNILVGDFCVSVRTSIHLEMQLLIALNQSVLSWCTGLACAKHAFHNLNLAPLSTNGSVNIQISTPQNQKTGKELSVWLNTLLDEPLLFNAVVNWLVAKFLDQTKRLSVLPKRLEEIVSWLVLPKGSRTTGNLNVLEQLFTLPANNPCDFETQADCGKFSSNKTWSQCKALCDFYFSTTGSEWNGTDFTADIVQKVAKDNVGLKFLCSKDSGGNCQNQLSNSRAWGSGVPCGSPSQSPWPGLLCIGNEVVVQILNKNNLRGQLPSSLGKMSNLIYLAVWDSPRLSGSLPSSISSLSNVAAVDLNTNIMSGTLPQSSMDGMYMLSAARNRLSGALADTLLSNVGTSSWSRLISTLYLRWPTALSPLAGPLFQFQSNRLSGSLPQQGIGKLRMMLFGHNRFSGSIPSSILQNMELDILQAHMNQLSGYLNFSNISKLTEITLQGNSISGSFAEHILWPKLTVFSMMKNSMSGSIPCSLLSSNSPLLNSLILSGNNLRGTICSTIRSVSLLDTLILHSTYLSGSLPKQFSHLTKLQVVAFGNTSLSGTIPSNIDSLFSLSSLFLAQAQFSGTLPASIGNLSRMETIVLSDNKLEGTLHADLFSKMPKLEGLYLSMNSFSGSLVVFPGTESSKLQNLTLDHNAFQGNNTVMGQGNCSSLQLFSIHKNLFTGHLQLTGCNKLSTLSAFNNGFQGAVQLPTNITAAMKVLYLFDNRLSCELEYNHSIDYTGNTSVPGATLVLPGNMISNPPEWLPLEQASFLFATNVFTENEFEICCFAVGCLILLPALVIVSKQQTTRLRQSVGLDQFERTNPYRAYYCGIQDRTAKLLAISSCMCLFLLPVYIVGANFYECGKGFLYITIAYLEDPLCEWAASCVFCCFGAAAPWCISLLRMQPLDAKLTTMQSPTSVEDILLDTQTSNAQLLKLVFLWSALIIFLSVPSALYTISAAMPAGDNTVGLGTWTLKIFAAGTSAVNVVLMSIVVPFLARALASKQSYVVLMMLTARFFILWIVPFTGFLLLSTNCYAMWFSFWSVCVDNPTSFSISAMVSVPVSGVSSIRYEENLKAGDLGEYQIPILAHDDVCNSLAGAYDCQACPRSMVDALFKLNVWMMLFNVVWPPLGHLLLGIPRTRQLYEQAIRFVAWLARKVRRAEQPETLYHYTRSADSDLVNVITLCECALVLGTTVPIMFPVACAAQTVDAVVYKLCINKYDIKLSNISNMTTMYLWISLAAGELFTIWFCYECQLRGWQLVAFGMPLATVASALASHRFHRTRQSRYAILQDKELAGSLIVLTSATEHSLVNNGDIDEMKVTNSSSDIKPAAAVQEQILDLQSSEIPKSMASSLEDAAI